MIAGLQALNEVQATQIVTMDQLIAALQAEVAILKNNVPPPVKKNSNNSHLPPSQDQNRPQKNQSLREPTDRKPGGQPGHQGTTLQCRTQVDETIRHSPGQCGSCGNELGDHGEQLVSTRQLIDIPPIALKCIEHQVYSRQCSCGHTTVSDFPKHVTNPVQYGPGVESLIGYLHTRQYLPYKRMQEFLGDVLGLPISTGGIHHVLGRLVQKARPHYQQIKERIIQSVFVGTDETGMKVNGKNHWMWTWQNDDLTFILHSDNRGFKTIEDNFANGLPNSVLQHDRFACHFNCEAAHHQICMAHLLRDLNYITEVHHNCSWSLEMKALIKAALKLKIELTTPDYYGHCQQRNNLETQLHQLLQRELNPEHSKARTLQKSLRKHHQYILYFLHHPQVPPDNNGSERAIRNIKVKQKNSGQFKSDQGADGFAVLRSVIDTARKAGQNILSQLLLIAKLETE